MALDRIRVPGRRFSWPLMLLLASVGVTAFAAFNAQCAVRARKRTGQRLQRDYASFTAWTSQQQVAGGLEGYAVKVADDGSPGLSLAREWEPDLVMLDLMLPGMDGYQVLRSMRTDGRQTPVLILSARGEEADKVRGFQLDADQYATKPFGLIEPLDPLREVWDHRAIVLTRTVDSHMAERRKQLEHDPADPRHFITIWKVGYRFTPNDLARRQCNSTNVFVAGPSPWRPSRSRRPPSPAHQAPNPAASTRRSCRRSGSPTT